MLQSGEAAGILPDWLQAKNQANPRNTGAKKADQRLRNIPRAKPPSDQEASTAKTPWGLSFVSKPSVAQAVARPAKTRMNWVNQISARIPGNERCIHQATPTEKTARGKFHQPANGARITSDIQVGSRGWP